MEEQKAVQRKEGELERAAQEAIAKWNQCVTGTAEVNIVRRGPDKSIVLNIGVVILKTYTVEVIACVDNPLANPH